MFNRFLIIITLLLAIQFTGNAQAVLKNLIKNASFEYTGQDTVRERPDASWTFTTDFTSVTGHVTTSRAIDGFRSFLIRAESGRGYLESEQFEVKQFENYLLSFGVCGSGRIETEVRWWQKESDSLIVLESEHLDIIATSDDWTIPQFRVTAPRRAAAGSVRFAVFEGQLWIDDVRFRQF
jgi:hypothetical protein